MVSVWFEGKEGGEADELGQRWGERRTRNRARRRVVNNVTKLHGQPQALDGRAKNKIGMSEDVSRAGG